jgi:hypothetical protein
MQDATRLAADYRLNISLALGFAVMMSDRVRVNLSA